jgi:nitrite reductase [NAD(P)H] small subunit
VVSEASLAAGVAYSCGPVDQIPYGEGRAFAVGDHQVAVFRKRDGSLRALSAICPHKGGPIADGQIDNRVVLCPLHLNAFELDTGCSTTGAPSLRTYPVHLHDGEIVVYVP